MERIPFKRGDSLTLTCTTDIDITGWTIQSQVRTESGRLVDTLSVNITQTTPTGLFKLTPNTDTSLWPLGDLYCDIQYTTSANVVVSTDTFIIELVRDETRL